MARKSSKRKNLLIYYPPVVAPQGNAGWGQDPRPPTLESVVLVQVLLLVMALLSVPMLMESAPEADRWARFMETSGFVDWPRVTSRSPLQPLLLLVPIVVCALFVLPIWCEPHRQLRAFRTWHPLLLLTAITPFIYLVRYMHHEIGVKRMVSGSVLRLARQSAAVTSFNRGYCES